MDKLYFEVYKKLSSRCDQDSSVKKPERYPCFALVFNYNWNDYNNWTWFGLHFFEKEGEKSQFIGEVKLMCKGEADTFNTLPESFEGRLDSNKYCSLGITSSYYQHIHDILKPLNLDEELLFSLCDCGYNIEIFDRFKEDEIFKDSLIRDLGSEKAYHDARFLLSGTNRKDAYSFIYEYVPWFDNSVSAKWELKLDYRSPDYLRNIGIIGENGVGKTQMLTQFVKDLLSGNKSKLNRIPLFNSVIVICSSDNDPYRKIYREKRGKPYKVCCLSQSKKSKQVHDLIDAARKIKSDGRMIYDKSLMYHYSEMVNYYLGTESKGLFIGSDEENGIEVNEDHVVRLVDILSSGQLQIFLLITHIFANIRMSSLLIIDEPEVHLHPHFIMEFMRMLGLILQQFDSFAVIATHSPLIVREIVDSQVFLMQQMEGHIPQIAPVKFSTFGEDATALYRNIFGYDQRQSYFTQIIETMLKSQDYESVVKELEKHMGLGMNARLMIRNIEEDLKEEKDYEES